MSRTLAVTVTKDGDPFLSGDFEVEDPDYKTVLELLTEVSMTHKDAAGMLAGYMHARDAGDITEDMGKLAMIAAVYVLHQGDSSIIIPLEDKFGNP